MITVCLDASTEILSVLVAADGGWTARSSRETVPRGETLAVLVRDLLGSLRLGPGDLVIAARGPGSFTGLRAGLALAKGLAYGSGCGFRSVPTLDVLAYAHRDFEGTVLPLIDAKRSRFYAAGYRNGERITEYLDLPRGEILSRFPGDERILAAGHHAPTFLDGLSDSRVRLEPSPDRSRIWDLWQCGLLLYNASGSDAPDSGALYIRRGGAED